MFIKKNYDNAIQTVRIEFGTLVGCEKDDEAYIVMKELPTMDMLKLGEAREKGASAMLEFLKEVMPKIITEHNLYETEEKKMSKEAVVELIYEKVALSTKVLNAYTASAFFTQTNKDDDK